jgi:hypothetical protein
LLSDQNNITKRFDQLCVKSTNTKCVVGDEIRRWLFKKNVSNENDLSKSVKSLKISVERVKNAAQIGELLFCFCVHLSAFHIIFYVQSNFCTTTTLRTPNLWLLLTGGRCSEVGLCYKESNWDSKRIVAVSRWSLYGGGR